MNFVRKLEQLPELEKDVDNMLQLCIETICAGHSVLIFCPTKKWCEKLAEQIAVAFFKLGLLQLSKLNLNKYKFVLCFLHFSVITSRFISSRNQYIRFI